MHSFRAASVFDLGLGLPGGARIHKGFALAYAAGRFAQHYKAIPASWDPRDALVTVHRGLVVRAGTANEASPRETISSYIEARRSDIVTDDQLRTMMSKKEFEACSGCVLSHRGRSCLLVSEKRAAASFPRSARLVKRLCRAGLLKTEGGKQPKLMAYPPLPYRDVGRVYWIRLGSQQPSDR